MQNFKEDVMQLIKENGYYNVGTIVPIKIVETKDNGVLISGGDITNDCWYTFGQSNGFIISSVVKTNSSYNCTIQYYLCDFYDWAENELRGGLVSDAEMAQLHKAGLAKEFEIFGCIELVYDWSI